MSNEQQSTPKDPEFIFCDIQNGEAISIDNADDGTITVSDMKDALAEAEKDIKKGKETKEDEEEEEPESKKLVRMRNEEIRTVAELQSKVWTVILEMNEKMDAIKNKTAKRLVTFLFRHEQSRFAERIHFLYVHQITGKKVEGLLKEKGSLRGIADYIDGEIKVTVDLNEKRKFCVVAAASGKDLASFCDEALNTLLTKDYEKYHKKMTEMLIFTVDKTADKQKRAKWLKAVQEASNSPIVKQVFEYTDQFSKAHTDLKDKGIHEPQKQAEETPKTESKTESPLDELDVKSTKAPENPDVKSTKTPEDLQNIAEEKAAGQLEDFLIQPCLMAILTMPPGDVKRLYRAFNKIH